MMWFSKCCTHEFITLESTMLQVLCDEHTWLINYFSTPYIWTFVVYNHGKTGCLCVAVESWACFILMATSVVFAVVCYTYYPPFGWFWFELVDLVPLPCCSEQVLDKGACLSSIHLLSVPLSSTNTLCFVSPCFVCPLLHFVLFSVVQYIPKLCQELIFQDLCTTVITVPIQPFR